MSADGLLEPVAAAEPEAVAAGSDAADEHEDRGDDADDRRQAQRQAEPVDERREQDGDEDSDHGPRVPGPSGGHSPDRPPPPPAPVPVPPLSSARPSLTAA